MSFLTQLEPTSCGLLKQVLLEYLASTLKQSDLRSAPGRPGGKKSDKTAWVLCEKVWLPLGPLETLDLSVKVNGRSKYVMTPSVQENLYRLCCCVAVQRYPVLLQGRRKMPTFWHRRRISLIGCVWFLFRLCVVLVSLVCGGLVVWGLFSLFFL
jgi:midasin (ATPase involved in ribosome maturation)